MMKRVYVAGAMNADNILDVLTNISIGIEQGAKLLEIGFAPFVPHLDIAFRLQQGPKYNVSMETYYEYTKQWLRVSDCVLVCPGYEKSIGTAAEVHFAHELTIPVYYSIDDLIKGERR